MSLKSGFMLFALLASGCAAQIQSGGFTVNQAQTERAFREVRNRAAFELACPPEQLQTVVLNVWGNSDWPNQVGAAGCGKRAVYVMAPSGGWLLNNETTVGAAPTSAPQQTAMQPRN